MLASFMPKHTHTKPVNHNTDLAVSYDKKMGDEPPPTSGLRREGGRREEKGNSEERLPYRKRED